MKVVLPFVNSVLGGFFTLQTKALSFSSPLSTASSLVEPHLRKSTPSRVPHVGDGLQLQEVEGRTNIVRRLQTDAVWNQLGYDIDGEDSGDYSGWSVALSATGLILVIGGWFNIENGVESGHARVYRWSDVNDAWEQMGQDICGYFTGQKIGNSVSISADGLTVAIGFPSTSSSNKGITQVYRWFDETDTWDKRGQDLEGVHDSDGSGTSVSLSEDGSKVAIGAYLNDENGDNSGSVRIYECCDSDGLWQKMGDDIYGESGGDQSGFSVSLSGNGLRVAIGAPAHDVSSGRTRVYEWSDSSDEWLQMGNDIEGDDSNDQLGYSVSLSSDGLTVAIGAIQTHFWGDESGYTRVYRWNDDWEKMGDDIIGEAGNDQSGCSVSISSDGMKVAIGSHRSNGDAGHTGIYSWNDASDSWELIGDLVTGEFADDLSGGSVSLSADGSAVAIGAHQNDDNGNDSGHVRVFTTRSLSEVKVLSKLDLLPEIQSEVARVMTGVDTVFASVDSIGKSLATATWSQLGHDIDGEAAIDISGDSLALASTALILVIGARGNDDNGSNTGHARVFRWNDINDAWDQMGQDISGDEPETFWGRTVSISADGFTVAIGSTNKDSWKGCTRIYKWMDDIESWVQMGQDLSGESDNDYSGHALSLNGDGSKVAIGAYWNHGNGTRSGHTRIYECCNSTGFWQKMGEDIDGEHPNDQSGWSVSLSGDGLKVAIGGTFNSDNGPLSGHTRVYSWNNTSVEWGQLGTDIDGEATNDFSGYSVSLSDDGLIVAIGAVGHNGYAGHTRVYRWNDDWEQMGQEIEGEASDMSGCSVSMSSDGMKLAIGATHHDENGDASGLVRIYEWDDNDTWEQVGQDIFGEAATDLFGQSVSLSSDGSIVAIGAPNNDANGEDSGHVRVFTTRALSEVKALSKLGLLPDVYTEVANVKTIADTISDEALPEIVAIVNSVSDTVHSVNETLVTDIEPKLNLLSSIAQQVDLLPDMVLDIEEIGAKVDIINKTSLPEILSNVKMLPDIYSEVVNIHSISDSVNETLVVDIKPSMNLVELLPNIASNVALIEEGVDFIKNTSLPEIKSKVDMIPGIETIVGSIDASLSESITFEADHLPDIRETVESINETLIVAMDTMDQKFLDVDLKLLELNQKLLEMNQTLDLVEAKVDQKLLEVDTMLLSKSQILVLVKVGGKPTDTNDDTVELSALAISKLTLAEDILDAASEKISTGKYLIEFNSNSNAFWIKVAVGDNEHTVMFLV